MTSQTKAKLYAVLTGILGLISGLAALPPSDQTAFLAALLAVFPPSWRGEVTAIVHLAMIGSLWLTAHYASSSPQPVTMTLQQTSYPHDPAMPTPIGEPPVQEGTFQGKPVERALPVKPPMA